MLDRLFKAKKAKAQPDWLLAYLALDFQPPKKQRIADSCFVVLDCEMTGLGKGASLITIGAVQCTPYELFVDSVFHQKFGDVEVGKSAEIHGELSEVNQEAAATILKKLLDYLSNRIIVGHNIGMDLNMLNRFMKSTTGMVLKNKTLDTAQLAIRLDTERYQRVVGGRSNLHLDDLCMANNIPIENRHTALGDAYLTALLFQRLLAGLNRRGVQTMVDLMR